MIVDEDELSDAVLDVVVWSARGRRSLARVLHHVKVAYRPGYPLEAKAYLGAVQHWLVAGAVRI